MMRLRKNSIEEDYFFWLCDLVEGVPDHKHKEFLSYLNRKEFFAILPNDDNRAEDGKNLREIYLNRINEADICVWNDPCSILEMIIALARRIEFVLVDENKGDRTSLWFWEMVRNLGLRIFDDDDPNLDIKIHENDIILETFHKRMYKRNGEGGLFTIFTNSMDQRKVEIWYQMQAWIQDKY